MIQGGVNLVCENAFGAFGLLFFYSVAFQVKLRLNQPLQTLRLMMEVIVIIRDVFLVEENERKSESGPFLQRSPRHSQR